MSRKNRSKNADAEEVVHPTKQERRQKLREKERQRMQQHGRSLAKVYRNAVVKRTKPSTPPHSEQPAPNG